MALIHELELLLSTRFAALVLPAAPARPSATARTRRSTASASWSRLQWPNLAVAGARAAVAGASDRRRRRAAGGVQLVGGRYREGRLLALGGLIEDAAGTFTPVEPRTV